MRPKRVVFHASSTQKQRKRAKPCARIWRNWNSRTRSRNRFTSKTRYRPPIPIPPMPRRAEHRPGAIVSVWSFVQDGGLQELTDKIHAKRVEYEAKEAVMTHESRD